MNIPKLGLIGLALLLSTPVQAQSNDSAGVVHLLKGRVTATSPEGDIRQIKKGSELYSSETLSTASSSYARMQLQDKSWIMLRPDSRFYLENVEYSEESDEGFGFFSLLKGGFRTVTGLIRDKLKYRYSTTVATIGIRGTSFMVRICNGDCFDINPVPENGLYLEVIDQQVILDNSTGQTTYNAGDYVFVANDRAVAQLLTRRPAVFVQSPIPAADPAECL